MDFRWVDYNYAQYKVQQLGIKSARQYKRWAREYNPGGFPVRPEKIYAEYWVDWNEFLNGNNMFSADYPMAVREKDLMPYWDAVSYVHPYRFVNADEYREAFDKGKFPKGIPRQPHLRYNTFYHHGGWKAWLGKDAAVRLEAEQTVDPVMVIYESPQHNQPNILSVMIHKKGNHALLDMIQKSGLRVVRLYHWYPDFADEIFRILDFYGNRWDDTTWTFPNVNEVLFELSSVLEIYKVG